MCGFVTQAAYVSNCDLLYKLIKVNAKIQCHLNDMTAHTFHKEKKSASLEHSLLELRRIHCHPCLQKAAAQHTRLREGKLKVV